MTEKVILLQAYGIKAIVEEAKYLLLSLLRVCSEDDLEEISIVIYTDASHDFNLFQNSFPHFELKSIDQQKIQKWRGEINFVHRVKIKVIQDFYKSFKGKIIYLDTDTYFLKNPLPLFDRIDFQTSLMHLSEGDLNTKGILREKLNRFFETTDFLIQGQILHVPAETQMWNAGVIGIQYSDLPLVDTALEYTDIWYNSYPKHVMEQLAFSLVLQNNKKLLPTEDYIYHYWDYKEFRMVLAVFFEKYKNISIKELKYLSAKIIPNVGYNEKNDFQNSNIFKKIYLKVGKTQQWHHKQIQNILRLENDEFI